jgi:hypothetical protein
MNIAGKRKCTGVQYFQGGEIPNKSNTSSCRDDWRKRSWLHFIPWNFFGSRRPCCKTHKSVGGGKTKKAGVEAGLCNSVRGKA